MIETQSYDLIILGAGPAGLTAGLYGSRAGLKTVVLDNKLPGGQMLLTEHILNYPGFPDGISGQALADLFRRQAEKSGCDIITRAGSVDFALNGERPRVITNEKLESSVPGIYAAGDVRKKTAKQVSTAIGDGALAAINAEKQLLMQGCGIEVQPNECQSI